MVGSGVEREGGPQGWGSEVDRIAWGAWSRGESRPGGGEPAPAIGGAPHFAAPPGSAAPREPGGRGGDQPASFIFYCCRQSFVVLFSI